MCSGVCALGEVIALRVRASWCNSEQTSQQLNKPLKVLSAGNGTAHQSYVWIKYVMHLPGKLMGRKGGDSACLHPPAAQGHRLLLPQPTGYRPRLQQDAEGVRPGAQVPVEEAPAGHGQLHPGHACGHLRAEHSVRRPGPDPARPRWGGAEARAGGAGPRLPALSGLSRPGRGGYGEARYPRAAGRQLRPASPAANSRLLNSPIFTGLLRLPPQEPFPLPWCVLLPALGSYKGPGLMSPPWDGRPPPRTGTRTSVPPALQPPPCTEESPNAVKTLPKPPLLTHGSHRAPVLCRAGCQNTITSSRKRDN